MINRYVTKIASNAIVPSEIDVTGTTCELAGVAVHLGPALGKRLSRLMREQGLNDRQLGEKALVSRAAVYKLRHNDGNNAGINTIYNLAKVLGVRACWLAYGEGPQTEPDSPRTAALEAVNALPAAERRKLLRELCGDEKTASD